MYKFVYMKNFFPNSCPICGKTDSLKRCSRCNLISYCGPHHQKINWSLHKTLCSIISCMMEAKGLSHIYENLRGLDERKWAFRRDKIEMEVMENLSRNLYDFESRMLRCPRVCFVCFETKQDQLTNCPNCPLATFCKIHQRSSRHHGKECHLINRFYRSPDMMFMMIPDSPEGKTKLSRYLNMMNSKFPFAEDIHEIPTTMDAFIYKFYRNVDYIRSMDSLLCLTELFSYPLSILNGFKKLGNSIKPDVFNANKLTICVICHIDDISMDSWESLLHLLPALKILTVIVKIDKDEDTVELPLCSHCSTRKKKLIFRDFSTLVASFSNEFTDCREEAKDPDEFHLNVFFDFHAPGKYDDLTQEEATHLELARFWKYMFTASIVLTTSEKRASSVIKLSSLLLEDSKICYHGLNDYAALNYKIDVNERGISYPNKFITVIKPQEDIFDQLGITAMNQKKFSKNVLSKNRKKSQIGYEKEFFTKNKFDLQSVNTAMNQKKLSEMASLENGKKSQTGKEKVDERDKKIIRNSIEKLREENNRLKVENEEIRKENRKLEEILEELKTKSDFIKNTSSSSNLKQILSRASK